MSPPSLKKCEDLLPTYHHLYLLPATCHYLYLYTTTCHCLSLHNCNYIPATSCHYLPVSSTVSTCHYLPVSTCHCTTCHYLPQPPPANTCHCFHLPQSDTTSTCHYLLLPATACHYLLLPDFQLVPLSAITCNYLPALTYPQTQSLRLPMTETIQQTKIPNNPQKFLLVDQTQNIFYLVCFLKPWFLTNITSKKGKTTRGFARFFCREGPLQMAHLFRGRTPLRLHNLQMTLQFSVVQSLGIEFSHFPLGRLFATKNMFYLVCFLKPWFLTNITAQKIYCIWLFFLKPLVFDEHRRNKEYVLFCWFFEALVFDRCHLPWLKKMRGFATYVPPSLSSATTCHYLYLYTTACHWLPLHTCNYIPATTCQFLPHPKLVAKYLIEEFPKKTEK